uniref:Uncharacterized protein n=1 Tax=Arundo donax TaxID=35708 RepID=A0A0A9HRA5_ARUDO
MHHKLSHSRIIKSAICAYDPPANIFSLVNRSKQSFPAHSVNVQHNNFFIDIYLVKSDGTHY